MAEDPAFLKELREEYDDNAEEKQVVKSEEKQVVKSDNSAPVRLESGESGESKQNFGKTKQLLKDPKDNFVVDDGVDRDAEWDKFEKDEAKRKADRKTKDEADKESEQKFREATKEKHDKQSERLQLWAPVLFMGPILPLIGSVIAVSLGFLILMSEHKLNGRPLSIANWFTGNCNYAFLYVILESIFSAIFLFVVMIILIDPGSTVVPNCCTISISRYCCKSAPCIGVWFGIIGVALLILNLAAIPMLWQTRQCVFVSAQSVGQNQNPYIWGTAAFLMVCYFASWPILIYYGCQACGWKKNREKKKAGLANFFTMKSKVDVSGYVSLKQDMAEDEAKEKEEKAALAIKKKEEKIAKKEAAKAAKEAAKKNAVTDISEVPVWPEGKAPERVPDGFDYPENDGILESDANADGATADGANAGDDGYYGEQQYVDGGDQYAAAGDLQYSQQYGGADQTW